MPLYWWTEKTIAGKYALVKPIPLKAEFESCEGWWMEFPNDDRYKWGDYEGEDESIKYIENNLDFFIEAGYVRKIDEHDQIYTMSLMIHRAFEENN